jgi:AcrR family transcriptional regulator
LTDKSVYRILIFMSEIEKNPRERIIESALRLFYQQGFRATGINQIIAESNVAKATFYHHFSSKEKLCVIYLQTRHTIWMNWLKESVDRQTSALSRLLGVFDFIRDWMSNCDFRGCAFLNIASEVPVLDSDIRNEVVLHKNSLKGYISRLLAEVEDSSNLHLDTDRQQIVDMLYVLVEGAIVASQNYGQVWPIDAARQAATLLLAR